jgi:hypothetical protein
MPLQAGIVADAIRDGSDPPANARISPYLAAGAAENRLDLLLGPEARL